MLRIPHIFGKRPDDDAKIKFRLNSAVRTKGPGHLCLESIFRQNIFDICSRMLPL